MTKLDDRLKAAFAADEPPLRDRAFTAQVLGRLERRSFLIDIAVQGAFALAAGGVLWGLWPELSPLIRDWTPTLAPAAALIAAGLSLLLVDRVMEFNAAKR
jgi:hypothetical protein